MTEYKGFWLISFDIRSDKRRRKAVKILEQNGIRVQYSVFELWLTLRKLKDIKAKLAGIIDGQDNIRYYPLCRDCFKKIINQGSLVIGLREDHESFVIA